MLPALVVRASQIVLALAIGFMSYSILRAVLGSLPDTPSARASAPLRNEAGRTFDEVAYVAFAMGDLFGAVDPGDIRVEAAPEVLAPTQLRIELLGTALDGDPAKSSALIRDVDGRNATVLPGDPIAGGRATVRRIERGRIVIEVGRRLEAVAFPRVDLSSRGRAGGPMPPTSFTGAPSPTRTPESPQRPAVPAIAGLEPVRGPGGTTAVRVGRVDPASPLALLGLEPGDQIVALGGVPVGQSEIPPDLFARIRAGEEVLLTVQGRDGRTKEVPLTRQIVEQMQATGIRPRGPTAAGSAGTP